MRFDAFKCYPEYLSSLVVFSCLIYLINLVHWLCALNRGNQFSEMGFLYFTLVCLKLIKLQESPLFLKLLIMRKDGSSPRWQALKKKLKSYLLLASSEISERVRNTNFKSSSSSLLLFLCFAVKDTSLMLWVIPLCFYYKSAESQHI